MTRLVTFRPRRNMRRTACDLASAGVESPNVSPDASVPMAFTADENPLRSSDGRVWNWLIESVGPASMLVAIEARMSMELRRRYAVEDVWQETLLHAWRDREKCEWHGVRAFRRWLLQIAEHRLQNFSDRERTQKRGGGRAALTAPASAGDSSAAGAESSNFAGPVVSTTPSRAASDAERARRMRAALDLVPAELRAVVHLHLFDELTFEEIAARAGITVSSAFRQFRRGMLLYSAELERVLHDHTTRRRTKP